MYASMCEEVTHVEQALSDVKEMIQEQYRQSDDELDWQTEWTEAVQKVLRTNSGWDWQDFWEMVEHNLRHPPCAVSGHIVVKRRYSGAHSSLSRLLIDQRQAM
jgi:hypothetical protein